MAVSVATLIKRRDALDQKIRETEERAKAAKELRKATDQAKYLLGGILLDQDGVSDRMKAILMEHAGRRRPSDHGGWQVIADRWKILLPDLVAPVVPPAPVPVTVLASISEAQEGVDAQ